MFTVMFFMPLIPTDAGKQMHSERHCLCVWDAVFEFTSTEDFYFCLFVAKKEYLCCLWQSLCVEVSLSSSQWHRDLPLLHILLASSCSHYCKRRQLGEKIKQKSAGAGIDCSDLVLTCPSKKSNLIILKALRPFSL